jgi:tetratricopeptide (TPR) repeat protein
VDRVERAAAALQDRGYTELPILAWALLDVAAREQSSELAMRASELAPGNPAVRFESARIARSLPELILSVAAFATSFPALVWVASWLGGALGAALLAAAGVSVAIGFMRALGLHGHAIGHIAIHSDPPGWPGMLLVLSAVALLPATGIGPLLLAAVLGLLALPRLALREALALALVMSAAGLCAGPGLDHWARIAALRSHDNAVFGAWRLERSQPLPGDLERLEAAVGQRPEEGLLRLALATARKRAGDIEGAAALLTGFPQRATDAMRARALNLEGILLLARGDVDAAVRLLERARGFDESAPILYNLSQAHGRALDLVDQTELFQAARGLDPELVSGRTALEGTNLHRYTIELPAPLAAYAAYALGSSPEAQELAADWREILLGPSSPDRGWLALPAAGLLGLLLRRASLRRCTRCLGAICLRCAPGAQDGSTCARCMRVRVPDPRSDARMRKLQAELDRRRQVLLARLLAVAGLVCPGLALMIEGRVLAGALRLGGVAAALGALAAARGVPAPAEVGGLAVLPLAGSLALLVPLYALGASASLRLLAGARPSP